jgi:outer membrane biosynthesis protein TonB
VRYKGTPTEARVSGPAFPIGFLNQHFVDAAVAAVAAATAVAAEPASTPAPAPTPEPAPTPAPAPGRSFRDAAVAPKPASAPAPAPAPEPKPAEPAPTPAPEPKPADAEGVPASAPPPAPAPAPEPKPAEPKPNPSADGAMLADAVAASIVEEIAAVESEQAEAATAVAAVAAFEAGHSRLDHLRTIQMHMRARANSLVQPWEDANKQAYKLLWELEQANKEANASDGLVEEEERRVRALEKAGAMPDVESP